MKSSLGSKVTNLFINSPKKPRKSIGHKKTVENGENTISKVSPVKLADSIRKVVSRQPSLPPMDDQIITETNLDSMDIGKLTGEHTGFDLTRPTEEVETSNLSTASSPSNRSIPSEGIFESDGEAQTQNTAQITNDENSSQNSECIQYSPLQGLIFYWSLP